MLKILGIHAALSLFVLLAASAQSVLPQQEHPFGLTDDIAIAQFGDVHFVPRGDVLVSPDELWAMAHVVKVQLHSNRMIDQLLFYRMIDLQRSLNDARTPAPVWAISYSSDHAFADGPLLTQLRWLDDSSGVGFLRRTDPSHKELYLADVHAKRSLRLGRGHDHLLGYAIKNADRYVLVEPDPKQEIQLKQDMEAPARVGTGKSYHSLEAPEDAISRNHRGILVSMAYGVATRLNYRDGAPILVYEEGAQTVSISPDATHVVAAVPLKAIPEAWPSMYRPSYPGEWTSVVVGSQDLNQMWGIEYVSQYTMISLKTGEVKPLLNAPTASRAGWLESSAVPSWSRDGKHVLLPSTFDSSAASGARPCAYVYDLMTEARQCVRELKRDLPHGFEEGWARVNTMAFLPHRDDEVMFTILDRDKLITRKILYQKSETGSWRLLPETVAQPTRVFVRADFQHSPVLQIEDTGSHRVRTILDPNPQLRTAISRSPELFHWTDSKGQTQASILFKPLGYRQGTRYPLVIQNHGFSLDRFEPSGGFASSNAAQELASTGIAVLQMRDCNGRISADEGPCNVQLYADVIDALDKSGIIDRQRVGLIGFSRTVYYVLCALTSNAFPIKAASLTDGISLGYVNFILGLLPDSISGSDVEQMIGAFPYQDGLDLWRERSPVFNLEKVSTPVRIVSNRNISELWETYALLAHFGKPVDLIVLNTKEHVITEPRIRMESQGGNIDWFRFWLQDWEDPDPAKRKQYERWEQLRQHRP